MRIFLAGLTFVALFVIADVAYSQSGQPDLAITAFYYYPAKSVTGNAPDFIATIKNQGSVAAGPFSSRLRIDVGNDGTWDVTPKLDRHNKTIGTSITELDSVAWDEPWIAVAGTHRYEVCLDVDEEIAELNENNNCSSSVLIVESVADLPDFVVGVFGVSRAPDTLTVTGSAEIKNQGSANGGPSHVRFRIDYESDSTWDVVFPDVSLSTLGLNSAQGVTFSHQTKIPDGHHAIEVCADSNAEISEANETNNCSNAVNTFPVEQSEDSLPPLTTPGYLDIVFIGNRYTDLDKYHRDVETAKSHLLTIEPFKSRAAEILFHSIDNTKDLRCYQDMQGNEVRCVCNWNYARSVIRDAHIPYDKVIMLADGLVGGRASMRSASVGAASQNLGNVFAHELAHTLGLQDEYITRGNNGAVSETCDANCCMSAQCVDWKNTPGAQCIPGCTYTNWYRSTEKSAMSIGAQEREFNEVSRQFLNKSIDEYTERIPPQITVFGPMDGQAVQGDVVIEADITDNVRVAWVDFYVDGGLYRSLWHTMQWRHPYMTVWSTWKLERGSAHTVYVKAYDLAGNVSVSPTIHVTIGGSAAVVPTISSATTTIGFTPSSRLVTQALRTVSSSTQLLLPVVQSTTTTGVSTTTSKVLESTTESQQNIIKQLQQQVLDLLQKIIAALEERLRILRGR